jgi:prolyl-tRNA synthetase
MRGREFLMKDAYSFDLTEDDARKSYNRMFVAYLRTFARMGLKGIPMRAETGPIGGDLSHEFIVLAETGESTVYCDKAVLDLPIPDETVDYQGDLTPIIDQWTTVYAATEDVHDPVRYEREVIPENRTETRGIEVGQVFYFGDKYSAPMKATITGPDGQEKPAQMGSYGVGVSRLLGAIIEASHDEGGIIWPEAVSPFGVGIVNLRQGDADCDLACETAYEALETAGLEPLYDDTDERGGAKFAKMDLIGLPWQLIVGPKGIKDGVVELKRRRTGERETLPLAAALSKLSGAKRGAPANP